MSLSRPVKQSTTIFNVMVAVNLMKKRNFRFEYLKLSQEIYSMYLQCTYT
jgi:hypothetical protein